MSSGTPYIGSKISLISKAKIRYEGFLYTIDSNDSTVTLAKVVSLGTEDRCPDHPVAAREEIFEYIVFRGTDIDDLHVCEAPKPQDPAIVHNGPVQAHQHNYHPSHHQHQGYSPFSGSMPPFGYPPYYSQKPQKPPSLPRTPTPPELAKAPGKEDKGHRYEQRDAKPSHRDNRSEKEHTDRNRRDRNDSQRQGRDNYHHDHKDNRYRDSYRRDRDNKEKETNKQEQQKKEDNKHRQNEDRRNEERRNEEERRQHDERRARARGGRGRGDNRQNQRNNQANRTKFTEDFDFESANAKFHKDEIQKELLRVLQEVKIKDDEGNDVDNEKDVDELEPLPTPEKYYDSSKSFFDNISCEAMQNNKNESSHDIMTRRQERTLNTETFGSSAANYRSYRHRGRGRGRGRGHFRSRGNFRGNSGNRSWVDYEFDYEAAGIKNHNRQVSASAGGS